MSKNTNLHDAKRAKKDEFYTQWVDIENEMNAYLDYNPDVFRGKTILLPCDDPEWSNFTRFFASHFQEYGIKKLISTSYATQSREEGQSCGRGKILIIDGTDINSVVREDLEWDYLQGDGDFRSDEIKALRDEADMVITNPPFSLFRDFMAWLVEGDVEFSVIGNMNAITYKEIFPLIKENKIWPGQEFNKTMSFAIPEEYFVKEGSEDKDRFGRNVVKVPAICWFTNIQHGRRNEPLPLITIDDNLRFNNRIIKNDNSYKTYDNYDAIEVPVTAGIPSDYEGVMGVPISFLDKYNPDQFEILDANDLRKPGFTKVKTHGLIKDADGTIKGGKPVYARILIRHKTQSVDINSVNS